MHSVFTKAAQDCLYNTGTGVMILQQLSHDMNTEQELILLNWQDKSIH